MLFNYCVTLSDDSGKGTSLNHGSGVPLGAFFGQSLALVDLSIID